LAQPNTLPFSKFVVQIDDGTGTFVAPCGFLKKAHKRTAQTSDTIVPDCDDPDAAAYLERNVVSLSHEVSGDGVMAEESDALWRVWWESGLSRNVRITYGQVGALNGGYYQGPAVLASLDDTVDRKSEGGRVQRSITIQNDGKWAWTANA
jgi:hypothetical protein